MLFSLNKSQLKVRSLVVVVLSFQRHLRVLTEVRLLSCDDNLAISMATEQSLSTEEVCEMWLKAQNKASKWTLS